MLEWCCVEARSGASPGAEIRACQHHHKVGTPLHLPNNLCIIETERKQWKECRGMIVQVQNRCCGGILTAMIVVSWGGKEKGKKDLANIYKMWWWDMWFLRLSNLSRLGWAGRGAIWILCAVLGMGVRLGEWMRLGDWVRLWEWVGLEMTQGT